MADEVDVYNATEQIAASISKVRSAMEAVVEATGQNEFDATLGRRLGDIQLLRETVDRVRDAERDVRAAGENVYVGGAAAALGTAFGGAQKAAGVLFEQISTAREELGELAELLAKGSDALDTGFEQLDLLEQMPGRKTAETQELRERLDNLKVGVSTASAGLASVLGQLERARTAVAGLETANVGIDPSGPNSAAIDGTSSTLETELGAARTGVQGLHAGLAPAADAAAVTVIKSEELATAARVGLNPPLKPGQEIASGSGEQDYRRKASGPSLQERLEH